MHVRAATVAAFRDEHEYGVGQEKLYNGELNQDSGRRSARTCCFEPQRACGKEQFCLSRVRNWQIWGERSPQQEVGVQMKLAGALPSLVRGGSACDLLTVGNEYANQGT